MGMDLDGWISRVKGGDHLAEWDLKQLCDYVKELLIEESNVQPISSPVTVSGDIHGQFHDLLNLFKTGGDVPSTNYVFMGDFVDRGYNSLETFTLLLCLKAKYPAHVTLLRGNHESRQITQVYGFYDECQRKYGTANAWKCCCEVFDYLTIAALIDGVILCVHGGLSPEIRTLDQIRTIDRRQEIPPEGAFCDLMWSDPEEVDTWAVSPRGAGWLFGPRVTQEFNRINKIDLICRAHQLVQEGYKYAFDEQIVTIWSAPNYCYRCGNVAAILQFDAELNREFLIFREDAEEHKQVRRWGSLFVFATRFHFYWTCVLPFRLFLWFLLRLASARSLHDLGLFLWAVLLVAIYSSFLVSRPEHLLTCSHSLLLSLSPDLSRSVPYFL
jgi:serine/threonine-protein phosphatase 6 catalytic subunit